MFCCGRSRDDTDAMISAEIAKERKAYGRTIKLLLLGAGDSGKSTVAKQLKIIHLNGFPEEERKTFKTAIASNIVTSIRTLVYQCSKFNYKLLTANESRATKILDIPRDQEPVVTPELADDIINLWQDPAIQSTYSRANEYQLNDSAAYYFENIVRLSSPTCIPEVQDVLRSRIKTAGILETIFTVEDITFKLVDVGGQRSERRKWIHCFDEVTAIIFCVAISEYNQLLYEDNVTNRMQESLMMFKELCSSKWFNNTSFILFMNKMDIFEEKIKKIPLTVCFPEYTGPPTLEASKDYIRQKFHQLNSTRNKPIYTHETTATNTNNIKAVFDAVSDIILRKAIDTIIPLPGVV